MMKHPMFTLSLRKTMLMAVLVLLAMGACKSKKKAVEPAPAPVEKEEVIKPTSAPAPVVRSADEIAVEKLESQFASIASASNVTDAVANIKNSIETSNKIDPSLYSLTSCSISAGVLFCSFSRRALNAIADCSRNSG